MAIGRCYHIQTPAGASTICDHASKSHGGSFICNYLALVNIYREIEDPIGNPFKAVACSLMCKLHFFYKMRFYFFE